jgi:phosphate transport system substrate-binding protein
VVDLVKSATGTIGYTELNYAKDASLNVALIQNRAGSYIEPSVSGTRAALDAFSDVLAKDARTPIVDAPATAKDAYPLSGITFIVISKGRIG